MTLVSRDASVLINSKFNPFLFAGVGTEANGSDLTILSLLARVGLDPWVEAGRLADLPKAAAANWLAEQILQMPLTAQALADAPQTSSRLVGLLPARATTGRPTTVEGIGEFRLPQWAMVAMVLFGLAIWLSASTQQGSSNHTVSKQATRVDH